MGYPQYEENFEDLDSNSVEGLIRLSRWIDNWPANRARDREAALWGRVAKVGEEGGEVIEAMIAATGQNPRKSVPDGDGLEFVQKELLDVAVTALGAIVHLREEQGVFGADPITMLHEHIAKVVTRAQEKDPNFPAPLVVQT